MTSGSGYKTNIENVQLYFNNDGETFEYAPLENGQLKTDLRQAWAGYSGQGYYDCAFQYNDFCLVYNGAPSINYLEFYKHFLLYAKLSTSCSSQSDVDYLRKCLEKGNKIEKLIQDNLAKQSRITSLKERLESQKYLVDEIKKCCKTIDDNRKYRYLINVDPPLPFPNREVKCVDTDGTAIAGE